MNITQHNKESLLEDLKDPSKALHLLTKSIENNQYDFSFIFKNIVKIYDIDMFHPKKTLDARHHAICELTNYCLCGIKTTKKIQQIIDTITNAMSPTQREQFEKKMDEFALTDMIFDLIADACKDEYHPSLRKDNKYTVLK